MQPAATQATPQAPLPPATATDEPQFNVVSMSKIVLDGSVNSQEDADRVIKFMNAMRDLLPAKPKNDETD